MAGQAQTGTGKTAAFLIATYQRLLLSEAGAGEKKQPRVFMLAPTRELAVQIANDAEILGKHTGFKIGLAFGGTDYEKQRRTIEDGIDEDAVLRLIEDRKKRGLAPATKRSAHG